MIDTLVGDEQDPNMIEGKGGDDKITCAGSAQAYNEFMDYVMQV